MADAPSHPTPSTPARAQSGPGLDDRITPTGAGGVTVLIAAAVAAAAVLLALTRTASPWVSLATAGVVVLLSGELCRRMLAARRDARRATARSREDSERLWSILDSASVGVAVSRGGRFDRASARLLAWFGADASIGALRAAAANAMGRSDVRIEKLLARVDARVRGSVVRELQIPLNMTQGPRCIGVQVRRVDPHRPQAGLLWTVTNRTAEWERRQGMVRDMLHDPLTGALNRRGLTAALEPLLARDLSKQPLGLMCLDLNGFKPLNERHGHPFGDRVLCTTHERLKRALRGNDLVARTGSDEFVVVLDPLDDARQAASIAERVSEVIAAPMLLEGVACQIQCSIGLAIAPTQGRNAEPLIDAAIHAMNEVRRVISPINPWRPTARNGQDRRSPR